MPAHWQIERYRRTDTSARSTIAYSDFASAIAAVKDAMKAGDIPRILGPQSATEKQLSEIRALGLTLTFSPPRLLR